MLTGLSLAVSPFVYFLYTGTKSSCLRTHANSPLSRQLFYIYHIDKVSLKLLLASLSGNLSSPTVLEKKLLKTRHSSSSFEIVLFPSVKFISSLFENLFKKSGTKNFPSTVTLLRSKLSI